MQSSSILILGGYGLTGKFIARLLLQETTAQLTLAGRSLEKARSAAGEFNAAFSGERVSAAVVDAADPVSLAAGFEGMGLVVVASSTAQYAHLAAEAALNAHTDLFDIQYSTPKTAYMLSLAARAGQAGCCFITDGGFHPGLPALMVRYAAQRFDRLERANVGSVIKLDWKGAAISETTVLELLEEMRDFQTLIFKDGHWKKGDLTTSADMLAMDFGAPFHRQRCTPMFLEEMRSLPDLLPTLQETGFYVGGFNWFVDWILMPIVYIGMQKWPQKTGPILAKMMHWGLNTFSAPPYETLLRVEARGTKEGHPKALDVTLSHPDGYFFTAAPVVAGIVQMLDGTMCKPGVYLQANAFDAPRMMVDMQRMGIILHENET